MTALGNKTQRTEVHKREHFPASLNTAIGKEHFIELVTTAGSTATDPWDHRVKPTKKFVCILKIYFMEVGRTDEK